MIDIHSHPLFGVDDGAKSFEISLAMCKMAAADGITHLVATPHCNYKYPFKPEVNLSKVDELKAALDGQLELLLGCDFHLSFDNMRLLEENRSVFTINRSSYMLVEFSDQFIPEQFDQVLYEIQLAGVTPILTHPERNSVFLRRPELVYRWVSRGCLVQVTAQSFTGHFGRDAQEITEMWLDRNLIHCFASDAHDIKRRPPVLSRSYKKMAEAKGKELADLFFQKNPEAIIHGKPLPPGPEPVPPKPAKKKGKGGWLSFLRH